MSPIRINTNTDMLEAISSLDRADEMKEALRELKDRIDTLWWGRFLEPPSTVGAGEITGSNGMSRVNWFNGRFLTAEALRKQDRYWQLRTQLLAQIHTPGIAWGLGLERPARATLHATPAPAPAPQGPSEVTISRGKLRTIDFVVTDFDTKPLDGVSIDVTMPDGSHRQLSTAGGKATIEGVGVGSYPFTVSAPGWQPAQDQGAVVIELRRIIGFTAEVKLAPVVVVEPPPDKPSFPPAFDHGIGANQRLTLRPGVAFDAAGRPIVVGEPFHFCIDDLLDRYRAKPITVSSSSTGFIPCVCIEPDANTVFEPGASIPEGPYLLVIEPTETPEGEAKVYGEICSGPTPVHCQADVWRDGFALSLVRYPFQVPKNGAIQSSFDLRGTLSAHYYDVWEHSLIQRWDPTFARDDRFCHGTGPRRHQPCAVPLAMLYINHDGSVSFIDPWIPRRTQVSSAARSWSENLFGAPTPAAAVARLHQFQCQLEESIEVVPLMITDANKKRRPGPNLYQRGFRHIPPVGFLPVDIEIEGLNFAKLVSLAKGAVPVGLLTELVCKHASAHFEGTNVISYCVVAPREDDALEDIDNAFEKDPVVLRPVLQMMVDQRSDWSVIGGMTEYKVPAKSAMLQLVGYVLTKSRLTTDALANRETEIVKLIIPLQGLRREYPIVGRTSDDFDELAAQWGIDVAFLAQSGSTGIDEMEMDSAPRADFIATAPQKIPGGLGTLPRQFVVYVKQRVVILEQIFLLLSWFETQPWLRTFGSMIIPDAVDPGSFEETRKMRQMFEDQVPAETRVMVGSLFKTPLMRPILVNGLEASADSMRREGLDPLFADVDKEEQKIREQTPDEPHPRLRAFETVVDTYAVENPEYNALKVPLLILDEEAAESVIRDLGRDIEKNPATDERGRKQGASVAKEVLYGDQYLRWQSREERVMWSSVRRAMFRQPAKDYMSTLPVDVDLGTLLDSTPERADKLAGGADKFSSLKGQVKKAVNEMSKGISVVAKGGQHGADLAEEYAAALERTGSAKKAYAAVARAHPQGEKAKYLKALAPIANHLDDDGFATIAKVAFRKA